MRKPVYFINKYHRSNFQELLKIIGPDKPEYIACSYILASIDIMDENQGAVSKINKHLQPGKIDFDALLKILGNNDADRALLKLAANLYDSKNDANTSKIFKVLDDVYQSVCYQALLIVYPSFSKTWDSRYPYHRDAD